MAKTKACYTTRPEVPLSDRRMSSAWRAITAAGYSRYARIDEKKAIHVTFGVCVDGVIERTFGEPTLTFRVYAPGNRMVKGEDGTGCGAVAKFFAAARNLVGEVRFDLAEDTADLDRAKTMLASWSGSRPPPQP